MKTLKNLKYHFKHAVDFNTPFVEITFKNKYAHISLEVSDESHRSIIPIKELNTWILRQDENRSVFSLIKEFIKNNGVKETIIKVLV